MKNLVYVIEQEAKLIKVKIHSTYYTYIYKGFHVPYFSIELFKQYYLYGIK